MISLSSVIRPFVGGASGFVIAGSDWSRDDSPNASGMSCLFCLLDCYHRNMNIPAVASRGFDAESTFIKHYGVEWALILCRLGAVLDGCSKL